MNVVVEHEEMCGFLIFYLLISEVIKTTSKISLSQKNKDFVPVPKVRRVLPEHEGKYKVIMPSGTTAKTRKLLAQKMNKGMKGMIHKGMIHEVYGDYKRT